MINKYNKIKYYDEDLEKIVNLWRKGKFDDNFVELFRSM